MSSPLTEGFLNSNFTEFELPEELSNRFDLLERIGSNDFSSTFIASERDTNDLYVLKLQTNPDVAMGNEALLLQNLKHKGLPVYENPYGSDSTHYTLRKYIDGEPLDVYLTGKNYAGISQMIDVLVSICDILIYLHSQPEPIIHRDIKPSNIIINPETNAAILIDFGISRKFQKDVKKDTVYFGTHDFAPPEQYGFAQTDCRTDIYSFGVVIRYWLTGTANNETKIQDNRLEKIASKCTALDPKSRFQSASSLKKALLRYKNRRRRAATSIAITAVAAIVIGLSIYVLSNIFNDMSFLNNNPAATESPDVSEPPVNVQTPIGYDDYEFQKLVEFFLYEDNFSKIQAQFEGFNLEIPGAWMWDRGDTWSDDDGIEHHTTNFILWNNGHVHEIFLYGLGLTGNLDVSGLGYLEILDIAHNNLTGLNVSGCISLRELRVGNNNLTSLDLTGLPALVDVNYYWNPLTEPVKRDG
ncbi:MAG: protein kinase [Oscillospiraceae bacterium]|nr:protein kinase [Oscillospiraceae bacterium]